MLSDIELIQYTLAQIEFLFLDGRITEYQLIAYTWLWRNCEPRKSMHYSWLEGYNPLLLPVGTIRVLLNLKKVFG